MPNSFPSRRHPLWIGSIIFGVFALLLSGVAVVLVYMTPDDSTPAIPGAPPKTAPKAAPSAEARQKLIGDWLRPDGGYHLVIQSVAEDGTMTAAYLNPRPINVAKAQAGTTDGKTTVFVELNDVGYPGSYYQLVYDPKADQMTGTYVQVAIKQSFPIEFVRVPAGQ